MITVKQKLSRARDSIFDNHPLFASIVARWAVHISDRFQTFATNGRELYVNPEFASKLSIAETEFLLLHEAGHIFLGHHLRMEDRNHEGFNVAADLAMNDLIRPYLPKGNLTDMLLFPGQGSYRDMPGGRSAEWYYDAMSKPSPEPEPGPGQSGESGESSSGQSGEPPSEPGSGGEDQSGGCPQPSPGQNVPEGGSEAQETGSEGSGSSGKGGQTVQPSRQGGEGSGKGSQSGGVNQPQEDPTEAQDGGSESPEGKSHGGGVGEVLPHPGSHEDPDKAEDEWRQVVAQAVNTARAAGKLPGSFYELAQRMLGKEPIADFRPALKRFMTQYTRGGFTYQKPNRRHAHRTDVILPTRKSRGAGRGCIIADTSGSMGDSDLDKVLRTVEGVLRQFRGSEIVLKQCDVQSIGEAERTFRVEDFPIRTPLEWKGRGGTDMNPALREVAKEKSKYRWVIVVSDMIWSTADAENPGLPTLWVSTGGNGFPLGKPKFGQLVRTK